MEGPDDSSVSERESSMATKRQDQISRKAPSTVFSTTTRQINENGEKTTRVVPTTTLLPTSGIQEVSVMELKLQPEVQDDCDICLETLSSLELEYSFCGSDCPLKACKECIAKHFKDTISSGYDGILRKMTCPACVKRSVPVSLWGPVCSSNQTTLYSRRAAILLTLQCSGCHERKTILPDEDENQVLPTDGMPKAVKEELLMEFERFNDGKINDQELYERISTYFFSFENLPNPWLVMQPILQKIRDEGFRAELYLRYLRHYPKVSTICCEAEQCFRCRTEDWHDGMTCEEMRKELEAEQLSDDVLNCPECDIQLVKGDGCEWVTCVCGHGFDWEELRRASLAAAFAAQRRPGGAPWAAAVIDAYPSSFAAPLVAGARAWQAAEPAAAAAGRAALWEALVGRAAAAAPLPRRRGGGATLLTPLLSAAGGAAEEVVEAEGVGDGGGVLAPRQYPPSTQAAAMRAAAAHAAAAAAPAARPAAAALFLPAERRLAAAWAEQAGAEIRAAREEEERAAVGAWEGLFGAGLPVTAVVRTVAPAMASRVSYYVTKTNYALCREGSSLTSAEIGTIPSGTVLAVSETYTLPCGKVRLHIIEPRRWVGWISKLDHLVMPHSQLQYSSDQSLVLSSNSFPLDLHAWVCANPESWEAAQVVSEVHKIRAWQFLYPIDPYQTAQDSASFDIFSPTLPPQHLEYLAAFTKNGRHKFLHDIRRVGNFAARHTEPLAAAYDIICRQDAYWEPDNSHEDLISAARLFCDTFRVASKKYLAQCWENKHGPYTMAVTKTLLDYEKQTKLKPKNMELMVLLADSLSKIQMKAWVSLNQAKLNAEEVQISTARQAVLKSFTTKVGFAPTPQSFTVLCLRHPKVLAPLNFLLAGSIALPENPSPLATAHGTPARNRKDAAAFQLLYGPSTVARRPAPGHMPLYRAWRALGCAPAAAAVLRLLDATPGLAAEAAALWPGRDLRYAALGRRRPVARLLQGAAAAAAAAAEQRQQEEGRRRCRPAGRRRCGGVQQTRATASGLSAAGARNRPMDPFASLVDQYNDTDFQYAVDFIPLVALSWKTNARKVDEEQGFLEELKNAYYLSRGPEGEALPKNIGILRKQHREQQLRLEELPDGCMEVAVVAPWLFPTNARALWGEVDNSSDDEGEGDSVLTLGKDNTCVTFEERHFEEQHFMSPGVPPAKQHRLTSIKDTYRNNNNSRNSHDDDEDKVNTELTKRLVESQRWRVVPVNDGGQTDCQSFRLESMKVPGRFLTFLSPITTGSVPSCPHPFDDRVVCMDPLSLTAQVHGGGEKHHALTKMKLTLLPYSWL